MKLSIITVNYNNADGLRATLQSVAEQKCRDFEYVVVDGGSTDGSVDAIREKESLISKWVSEPDGGIYEAMNKGVSMASGDYVLFLNSADRLAGAQVVEKILPHLIDKDYYVGGVERQERGGVMVFPPKTLRASYLMMNYLPHQATFIRRQLLLDRPYQTKYRIAADWEQMVYELVVCGKSYELLDICVTLFDVQGISSVRSTNLEQQKEREAILHEHFSDIVVSDYVGLTSYESKIKYALLKDPSVSRDMKILRNALKMVFKDIGKRLRGNKE